MSLGREGVGVYRIARNHSNYCLTDQQNRVFKHAIEEVVSKEREDWSEVEEIPVIAVVDG